MMMIYVFVVGAFIIGFKIVHTSRPNMEIELGFVLNTGERKDILGQSMTMRGCRHTIRSMSQQSFEFQGYNRSERDYNFEQNWDYNHYEPEMAPFTSYQEEYNGYYHEYNDPPSDMATILSMIKKAEEKQEKRDIEARLKEEIRDKALEALVKQVGKMAEDVALLKRERDERACGIVDDSEVDEGVTGIPEQENECLNLNEDVPLFKEPVSDVIIAYPNPLLASITQTNKVGEEVPRVKIRKVGIQDLGQSIMKWLHNNFSFYMPIIGKQLWNWYVNYRAFVGNVAGKCALRPP